jgi:hypothetical protein
MWLKYSWILTSSVVWNMELRSFSPYCIPWRCSYCSIQYSNCYMYYFNVRTTQSFTICIMNKQMHTWLTVYYTVLRLLLLHVSTSTRHPQGALVCLKQYRVGINYWSILQNHIFTNTEQKYMKLLPLERGMFAVHSDLKCIRCPGDTPIPAKPSQACLAWCSRLWCWCTLTILVVSLEVVGCKHIVLEEAPQE